MKLATILDGLLKAIIAGLAAALCMQGHYLLAGMVAIILLWWIVRKWPDAYAGNVCEDEEQAEFEEWLRHKNRQW